MNIYRVPHFFPDTLTHGFFGRQGGVSSGLYDSLNCSYQSHDLAENIDENRLRVVRELHGQSLSTLKQIHSSICFPIENSCMTGIEEGDALVTKTAGQVIGCLTADCGPVLFAGTDGLGAPVIGAAHAGWGGALKGVLESTIAAMLKMGAELSTIKAAIGPCIAQESYEVGAEFLTPFIDEDERAIDFFTPTLILPPQGGGDLSSIPSPLRGEGQDGGDDGRKVFFNLPAYIHFRLTRAGIGHIATANSDTYAQEHGYFSFRRATHRGEADYGRQISAICIRSY